MKTNEKIDLLRRAGSDLWNVNLIMSHEISDPVHYDTAAYHVQQATEKVMKYVLQQNGIEFLWTHDISELVEQMIENKIDVPNWISEVAGLLTGYESKTRYLNTLVASKAKLEELIPLITEYLRQQQTATYEPVVKNCIKREDVE